MAVDGPAAVVEVDPVAAVGAAAVAETVAIVVEIEAAGAGNCFPKITHGNSAGERFEAPRFRFRRRDLLDAACRITGLPSHAAEFL
ncbi:MAG TPA: hypothetical protein VNI36_09610 [Candidatus Dormibacteraeota bacterium]|nr:hypothetical protein [Candidatus Dormibacteraeota bacterium]